MDINEIKKVIEALLFVSDKPLLTREIKHIVKEDLPENTNLEGIIKDLQTEYQQLNRAFQLNFVADGWTFATKPEYAPWIKTLLKDKTTFKLSPSAMEVLAIIAYKQPITRAEIDSIRGVDSGGVMDTLLDRKLIKIVGKKETIGKPMLYGTTQEFLRHFGLSHLSELPVIETNDESLNDNESVEENADVQELPFEENKTENSNVVKEEGQQIEGLKEQQNNSTGF